MVVGFASPCTSSVPPLAQAPPQGLSQQGVNPHTSVHAHRSTAFSLKSAAIVMGSEEGTSVLPLPCPLTVNLSLAREAAGMGASFFPSSPAQAISTSWHFRSFNSDTFITLHTCHSDSTLETGDSYQALPNGSLPPPLPSCINANICIMLAVCQHNIWD